MIDDDMTDVWGFVVRGSVQREVYHRYVVLMQPRGRLGKHLHRN